MLKACIDNFIAEHVEDIDTDRIYIGGYSNGGFMTMRMIIDYPGFFAAAIPCCQVFYNNNVTEEILSTIKNTPIWFVHAKYDELVPPMETTIPIYHRLTAAGAANVHLTWFSKMEDLSGMYRDASGRPQPLFNHSVWIHAHNDDCITDFDGRRVIEGGVPVTMWEWVGMQKLKA